MEVNYKKTILMTILFTLLALVVSAVLMFLLLYFVFSKDLADFCYKLGNYNMASSLYIRTYNKDGEISNCYRALTLDIQNDNYKGIVRDYELFVADEDYDKFMSSIMLGNNMVSGGVLEKSALTNEYNYLEDKYTLALIKTNAKEKAFCRAIKMFAEYQTYTFKNQGYYSLNRFISSENLDKFQEKYDGYSDTLANEMQAYFDMSKVIFDDNDEATELLDKAYLVSLGNRLIMVGQNINSIYSGLNINAEKITQNQQYMTQINDIIKGMI